MKQHALTLSYMQEALKEAQKAFDAGEVPVGAVIVYGGEIIARAHNEIERRQDATAHAEMLCLRAGAERLERWRLNGATLYTTVEPCSMCAGALLLSRIDELVWGARDLRHGADGSFIDLLSRKHPTHALKIVTHVLEESSADLMRRFFQQRRRSRSLSSEELLLEREKILRRPRTRPVRIPPTSSSEGRGLQQGAVQSKKNFHWLGLFEELTETQRKKLYQYAREIIPRITEDDILQPNDFPALENHPGFRYEEGILEGLLTARMAYLAKKNES